MYGGANGNFYTTRDIKIGCKKDITSIDVGNIKKENLFQRKRNCGGFDYVIIKATEGRIQ
ncbi:MAG TPA: hypothetical protein DD409_07445 [Bacteroidales bacterium]|nr:hypothetical protein [Bacteroidales bacterium]